MELSCTQKKYISPSSSHSFPLETWSILLPSLIFLTFLHILGFIFDKAQLFNITQDTFISSLPLGETRTIILGPNTSTAIHCYYRKKRKNNKVNRRNDLILYRDSVTINCVYLEEKSLKPMKGRNHQGLILSFPVQCSCPSSSLLNKVWSEKSSAAPHAEL